jgi:hypothetical protein
MSDAAAFTILGVVALVLGWPWWAIGSSFAVAGLLMLAEARAKP